MSLMDDVYGQLAAKQAAQAGPQAPYIVSKPLPSFSDIQSEIDSLTATLQRMDASPFIPQSSSSFGYFTREFLRRDVEGRLKAKQKVLDSLTHPSRDSGIPPAPEGPAVLGPRIATPKVGLDDLKIFLPR